MALCSNALILLLLLFGLVGLLVLAFDAGLRAWSLFFNGGLALALLLPTCVL